MPAGKSELDRMSNRGGQIVSLVAGTRIELVAASMLQQVLCAGRSVGLRRARARLAWLFWESE